MKFFVSLIFIAIVATIVYYVVAKVTNSGKQQKPKKNNKKPLVVTAVVVVILLGLLRFLIYTSDAAPDTQCTTIHSTTSHPPTSLKSSMDYFTQGNYDYDIGNCKQAIADYTKSITLHSQYAQAYNNRAYTYMRMRAYKNALPDLNTALALQPNYIQALMNRGDMHNYYYAIDRQSAIADYEKVISLGGTHGTSVCGHLFLAMHNGWNIGTLLDFPRVMLSACH